MQKLFKIHQVTTTVYEVIAENQAIAEFMVHKGKVEPVDVVIGLPGLVEPGVPISFSAREK